jgi:glucose/arabinose dehydrogenase
MIYNNNYNHFFSFNGVSIASSSSSSSSNSQSSSLSPSSRQQQQEREIVAAGEPSIIGSEKNNLKVENFVAQGLSSPTSMAFVDPSNLLVLQKGGQVRLVSNGILQKQPVLAAPVDNASERGLLGIAVLKKGTGFFEKNIAAEEAASSSPLLPLQRSPSPATMTTATTATAATTKVFLYFTESNGKGQLRNRIYKYNWDSGKHLLLNPKLILDVSALPGPNHNGGKLAIGPDQYLYAVIGNLNAGDSILQNDKHGRGPHDTSVIFRIDPNNGLPATKNPFSSSSNNNNSTSNRILSKYYAYGIRNSFGITFDPITGRLWDTENGETRYDEINLVTPGFNSGWQQVMGPISRSNITESDLVNLRGSHYADPAFSWLNAIGVTDIEFLKSSKLGSRYTNNIFVGDINNGNLYYFELNKDRTGLKFGYNSDYDNSEDALLSDFVADDKAEVSTITFGTGFGGITDIKTGPDGFLYILSYFNGSIYRIVPANSSSNNHNGNGNNNMH